MNVPKYLWPNPSGSGWVDAWNGWYPTLEFAVSELQGANLEEPWVLSPGDGLRENND